MSNRVHEGLSDGNLKPQLEMFGAAVERLISTYGTPGHTEAGDFIEQVDWGDVKSVAKYRATRYSTDAAVDPEHLHTVILEKGETDETGGLLRTFVAINPETGTYMVEQETDGAIIQEEVAVDDPDPEHVQLIQARLREIGRGLMLLESKYANDMREAGVPEGSDDLIASPEDDPREWFLLDAGSRLHLASRDEVEAFGDLPFADGENN